jgi:hypothetical protein
VVSIYKVGGLLSQVNYVLGKAVCCVSPPVTDCSAGNPFLNETHKLFGSRQICKQDKGHVQISKKSSHCGSFDRIGNMQISVMLKRQRAK